MPFVWLKLTDSYNNLKFNKTNNLVQQKQNNFHVLTKITRIYNKCRSLSLDCN
jgi:hypothetical protein